MRYVFCALIALLVNLPISHSIADEKFTVMLNQVKQVKEEYNIAGVGLVIVDNQKTLHQAYLGLADREREIPVEMDTVFRIGSITKTFTSLAVLRLAEQGKLSLQDPISKYAKELPYINTYASSPIRIAHLLEHTAGFRDMTQKEFDFKQTNWNLQQSLAYDSDSRVTAWMPGEYFSYTNSGAGITAWVIEQVSQQSFEDYVQQNIFQPLQLTDATFFNSKNIQPRLASGYDTDGKTIIPYWHMLFRSFGAINARVNDMARFVRMLLNYGKADSEEVILSVASIRRLEVPMTSLAARNGLRFGYGLGNYQWLRDGVLFHGHGGDADGYLARYGYTRENNRGYFLVINAYNNRAMRKIERIVESWLIRGIKKRSFPAAYKLSAEKRKEIVGEYVAITNRFSWVGASDRRKLKIFEKNNNLFTQFEAEEARQLVPVNEKHFRRAGQPIATISITNNLDGIPILQGDLGNFRNTKYTN